MAPVVRLAASCAVAAVIGLLAGAVDAGAAPASTAPVPRSVVLYGDSLSWEAQEHVATALGRAGVADVRLRTFGGTAICDWLGQMRLDAALRPDVVVVQFSGNAVTPCMRDGAAPFTGDALVQKYAADARTVADIFQPSGSAIVLIGSPPGGTDEARRQATARINATYTAIAAPRPMVRYADAGAAVLQDHRWTATMRCLPTEPCTGGTDSAGHGINVVRAPDALHFCPQAPAAVRGVTASCDVWSSGAFRFGTAMAAAALGGERLESMLRRAM